MAHGLAEFEINPFSIKRERERYLYFSPWPCGLVPLPATEAFFCPLRVLVDLRFGRGDVVERGSLRQNRGECVINIVGLTWFYF